MSQGKENTKKNIWKFTCGDDDPKSSTIGEAYLFFVQFICSQFNNAILKLEGDNVEVSEVFPIFDGLRKEFEYCKDHKFVGLEANKILNRLENENKKKKFIMDALNSYERLISYLDKWFPLDKMKDGFYGIASDLRMKDPLNISRLETLAQIIDIEFGKNLIF